ncbi:hypothetical protein TELCIR_05965 [Teladorsagia circumcincta]|uniref:Transmembrane protein n=1 Tax=Teladorsagia circumcincta TaxID=45464 RepID=A0A2G9UPE1_TELCI|nr:hypothetical protein TELCIR_05965 [Teladorsagia circumcincta]
MAPACDRDPHDGLAINNAWKTLIDSGLVKKHSKSYLKAIYSSASSPWNSVCVLVLVICAVVLGFIIKLN